MFSFFRSDSSAADLYMDLGTANTLIAARGVGVVLNEPSVVVFSAQGNKKKILGVGLDAQKVLDKTPGHVSVRKPVREGVIADFDLTHEMLQVFLNRPQVKKLYSRPRMVVSLPFGVTEVEKKAVVEACEKAGCKKVFLIDEPMASAMGAGIKVKSAEGNMIIDIGGGTTEIAVIALSDIVYCEGIRIGGHKIDEDIISYMRSKKGLVINDALAEELKIKLGTAMPKKNIQKLMVQGRDIEKGLLKSIEISSEEVGEAMNAGINEILRAVHKALEQTPPELISDLMENGIWIAGGGAVIRDLDLRIQNEVRLPVHIADEPLTAIARGGMLVLDDPDLLEKIEISLT